MALMYGGKKKLSEDGGEKVCDLDDGARRMFERSGHEDGYEWSDLTPLEQQVWRAAFAVRCERMGLCA